MGQNYASESYFVADKIRQIREKAGISQEELADRLSVAPCTVYRIESGRRQLPLETLFRFSDVMDVPVNDLLPANPARKKKAAEEIRSRYSQLSPANQQVVQDTVSSLITSLLQTQS